VVRKYHVRNLISCMLHNITYMVPDAVRLMLLHFHFTDKGGTEQQQSIKCSLIDSHCLKVIFHVKLIRRRVSLHSCEHTEDCLKRWVFVVLAAMNSLVDTDGTRDCVLYAKNICTWLWYSHFKLVCSHMMYY